MEKKTKMIIAIAIVVILIIVGILFVFLFITQSRCQCGDNDFDNFVGTWESISTPRTETTYYSDGTWETKYLDITRSYNGTWEIKNNSIIKTRHMGDTEEANVTIEYGYEFYDDCNELKLWNRAEEDSGYVIVYMPYKKKC
jgi:hypothetical protein